jgi:hypothetical protein
MLANHSVIAGLICGQACLLVARGFRDIDIANACLIEVPVLSRPDPRDTTHFAL